MDGRAPLAPEGAEDPPGATLGSRQGPGRNGVGAVDDAQCDSPCLKRAAGGVDPTADPRRDALMGEDLRRAPRGKDRSELVAVARVEERESVVGPVVDLAERTGEPCAANGRRMSGKARVEDEDRCVADAELRPAGVVVGA